MPESKHTIIVWMEDEPGALTRLSNLFRRRNFNIESLSVGQTEEPGLSRLTFVVSGDDATIEQMEKQLYKLLDVIKVVDVRPEESVTREMALVKVAVNNPSQRAEVLQYADIFKAKVLDVSGDTVLVEIVGDEDEVERFVTLMRRFGIKESVRTGRVAMLRGSAQALPQPVLV